MKNILKRDLKYLFYQSKKPLSIYLLLLILSQIFILSDKKIDPFYSFLNLVYDDGYIYSLDSFTPPLFWLMFQLVPVCICTFLIYKDFDENSSYMVVKCLSRKNYFTSKILSGFIGVSILNIILFILLIGDSIILKNFSSESFYIILRIIFYYIISQFILFFIGFILSIKLGYKFGISAIFIELILSMTTNGKWYIGQASLAFKQDILSGYISMRDNMAVFLIHLFVLLILSIILFKNYDFLGGRDD